jgi:dolichol kinase
VTQQSLRHELARKAIHLTAAVFPLGYAAGMARGVLIAVLVVLAAVALIVEVARARHERTRQAFTRATGPLLRPHEGSRISGATWLVLALLVAVVVFPRDVAIAVMWAATVGDALAALFGRAFGQLRLGSAGKTLEGSAACFAATLTGSLAIAHLSLAESIVSAITSSAAEFPSRPWDDNVRVVVFAGSAILLWRIAFS